MELHTTLVVAAVGEWNEDELVFLKDQGKISLYNLCEALSYTASERISINKVARVHWH